MLDTSVSSIFNLSFREFFKRWVIRERHKAKTNQTSDNFWNMHEKIREHSDSQTKDSPVRPVLKIDQFSKGFLLYEIECKRTNKVRPNPKANHDDEKISSQRKRTDDAIEWESRVEHVEVDK